MFAGVLALLERSLRVDARSWGPHLARFGLMATIYIALSYANATSAMFGAPGLRFFQSIAYLNLSFMTLLGIGFFSTAVTEEKEEDTLGLMLMAGISPLGILLGKSGGRLVQALLLIAVQYPFTLLAVTLGGITRDQVASTYMGMLSYLVMLAGIGMFCSTISTSNRSASFRLILIVIAYWMIPIACKRLLVATAIADPFTKNALSFIAETCIFIQMGTILTSGFQETLWSRQVVTNLILGLLGFALSWGLFGVAVREPSTESNSRGLVTRSKGRMRWFSPGRPWYEPMPWKDFHFVAGGFGNVLLRFGVYALIWYVATLLVTGVFGPVSANPQKQAVAMFLGLGMFAVSFDAGLLVSRSLNEEIRSQTLSTLLLLPVSTGHILYGKVMGSLLGWLPGPICMAIAMSVPSYGREATWEFFKIGAAAWWLIAHLILVPHAAAIWAMFARWGALPLGIATAFGSLFLSVSMFEATRASQNAPIVWVVTFGVLGICMACHVGVWLKTQSLCAR